MRKGINLTDNRHSKLYIYILDIIPSKRLMLVYIFIIVLSIRYKLPGQGLQVNEHSINVEDARHNEERYFFGLCPVSLRTSCLQDPSSTTFTELKVIVIN